MRVSLFLIFYIVAFNNIFSQTLTLLEKDLKMMDITLKTPKYLVFSGNTDSVYPAEISEKYPLATLAQSYDVEMSFGDTYINTLWGMITSIAYNKDKDYYVFISTFYVKGDKVDVIVRNTSNYTKEEKDMLETLPFSVIKHKFKYGARFKGVTEYEAYELYQMLKFWDTKKAKSFCNGNIMFSFPVNLRGTKYKDKYTRCKAVGLQKGGKVIFLYFMMTDQQFGNFNSLLEDFSKVFWFKD